MRASAVATGAALALALGGLAACAPAPLALGPVGTASPATTAPGRPLAAATSAASATRAPRTATSTPSRATGPALRVVDSAIPFGPTRLRETAAYSLRHYGDDTWRLTPSMIVLHYTAGDSWQSARDVFAADVVNLGELPGTCAHDVVDTDGTVHALVPTTVRCRHTIGLNDRAIGIEVVQPARDDPREADREILARAPQREALLALVRRLMQQYSIPATAVIGHAMANDDPRFRDLLGWRNDHVDWQEPDVLAFRALL